MLGDIDNSGAESREEGMRLFVAMQRVGTQLTKIANFRAIQALTLSVVLAAPASVVAQDSANADLDQCMRASAAKGAVVGAVIGGIFGALVGGDSRNRDRNAVAGAAAGAAAGGFLSWRNAWSGCSSKFVKAESVKTASHVETAQRIGYKNQGTYAKITGTRVQPFPEVRGGEALELTVQYDVLIPDGKDVEATVLREIYCKDDEGKFIQVVSFPEKKFVQSGQQVSKGEVRIPNLPKGTSTQECQVNIKLQAQGVEDQRGGTFLIKTI